MGDGLDPNRILRFVAAERITVIPFLAPTKVERDALPAGEVGEIAVRGTSTIRLKAEFDNKDNALWPGLAVTTALQLGVDKGVLIVPDEVVQHGQSGLYVFIIDDQNRAQVRQVKLAREDTTTAVISDGLREDDRVMTSGQFLLQPGSIVSIDPGSGT